MSPGPGAASARRRPRGPTPRCGGRWRQHPRPLEPPAPPAQRGCSRRPRPRCARQPADDASRCGVRPSAKAARGWLGPCARAPAGTAETTAGTRRPAGGAGRGQMTGPRRQSAGGPRAPRATRPARPHAARCGAGACAGAQRSCASWPAAGPCASRRTLRRPPSPWQRAARASIIRESFNGRLLFGSGGLNFVATKEPRLLERAHVAFWVQGLGCRGAVERTLSSSRRPACMASATSSRSSSPAISISWRKAG